MSNKKLSELSVSYFRFLNVFLGALIAVSYLHRMLH